MKKTSIVLCCALVVTGAFAQTLNSAVTGGGTTNYIAKWSSSTTLTTSALCQSSSGGNIGIGTCSPTQRLQVNSGNVIVKGPQNFNANGQSASVYLGDINHPISAQYGFGITLGVYQAPKAINIIDGQPITANTSGHPAYVGIGTTAPDAVFTVSSDTLFNSNCDSGCAHSTLLLDIMGLVKADMFGNLCLGSNCNVQDITNTVQLSQPLVFPDGTFQTTAYNAPAVARQQASIRQLQRDRDTLLLMVKELRLRVAQLEKSTEKLSTTTSRQR